jgi:hypothetical protein
MMRFTVVDNDGTITFVGPPHGLKALAAACSAGATNYRSLIESVAQYDRDLSSQVFDGLAVFDEHVVSANPASVQEWLQQFPNARDRPLRVVDETTRRVSLEPRRLGVIIFNLIARRIVQVQNNYAELLRSDRGRVRVDGRPTRQIYRYSLPDDWSILP